MTSLFALSNVIIGYRADWTQCTGICLRFVIAFIRRNCSREIVASCQVRVRRPANRIRKDNRPSCIPSHTLIRELAHITLTLKSYCLYHPPSWIYWNHLERLSTVLYGPSDGCKLTVTRNKFSLLPRSQRGEYFLVHCWSCGVLITSKMARLTTLYSII